jgi:hypothetical protein
MNPLHIPCILGQCSAKRHRHNPRHDTLLCSLMLTGQATCTCTYALCTTYVPTRLPCHSAPPCRCQDSAEQHPSPPKAWQALRPVWTQRQWQVHPHARHRQRPGVRVLCVCARALRVNVCAFVLVCCLNEMFCRDKFTTQECPACYLTEKPDWPSLKQMSKVNLKIK